MKFDFPDMPAFAEKVAQLEAEIINIMSVDEAVLLPSINLLGEDAFSTPASPPPPSPKKGEQGYAQHIMKKLIGITADMYCVKCRTKQRIDDGERVYMKNGKPALKGRCPVCQTGMYKIG